MARRHAIKIRDGRIRRQVEARTLTLTDEALSRTAERLVGRLVLLLARELAQVRLTDDDVGVLEQALGHMRAERHRGRPTPTLREAVAAVLRGGCRANQANTVRVRGVVDGLTPVQTLAVLDALERLRAAFRRNDHRARRRILDQFGEPEVVPIRERGAVVPDLPMADLLRSIPTPESRTFSCSPPKKPRPDPRLREASG